MHENKVLSVFFKQFFQKLEDYSKNMMTEILNLSHFILILSSLKLKRLKS